MSKLLVKKCKICVTLISNFFKPKKKKMQLHVVSFDVPFPPDYGGAIDVFFKLKALQKQGIRIILHCFVYGRQKANILEDICEKVFYYERKKIWNARPFSYPYIVSSRQNDALLKNLCHTKVPILFEGLQKQIVLKSLS